MQKFQTSRIALELDALPHHTSVSPQLNFTGYTVGYFSASKSLHCGVNTGQVALDCAKWRKDGYESELSTNADS